jgi:hypothetical protein
MNNQSSGTGFIIGIIVVVVIAIVGYLAYQQGFFKAKTQDSNGIEVKIGETSY